MFSDSYRPRDLFFDLLATVAGSLLLGFAVSVFTAPNDIAPGGVTGLATALAAISPLRISLWALVINVPLMLGAWRSLGKRVLVFTLTATFLLSGFIELFDTLVPHYVNNMLLASVCGGVFSGLGVAVLFLRGISSGGTDLLALLLRRILPNVPSGTLLLGVDATVVAIAVLIFRDIEVALYSTITIYVCSKVIDALMAGVDYAKVIYIVTERGDEVSAAIIANTERGTTLVPAVGGYTGADKNLIITVTRRNYLAQTLRIIKQADPAAFTFVVDSTEVHGEGFKTGDSL